MGADGPPLAISKEDRALLWRAGRLRYLLHSDQKLVYDKFVAWRQGVMDRRVAKLPLSGKYPRVFIVDCSRRWGKDWFGLTLMIEQALRKKGATLTYATAHQKDIGDIINSPDLFKKIMDDCPRELQGVYKNSYGGQAQGLYFPNGSIIKLVGIDLNPDGLRGRGSDGMCVSEAGFCSDLDKTVESILLPQFLGRDHATLIMNSTPPESGAHAWDTEFVPDAIDRGAYVMRTIWDAPQYSDEEKREHLKIGPDGTIPERQRREFLCERIRESTRVVIPEFNQGLHVREFEVPEYAHAYVAIDPAVKDLCAINFAVWDFENHRLLIQDEWTKRNANTNEVADVIKTKERLHWDNLLYWNGKDLSTNPWLRVSDVDQRLITDLTQLHGIKCAPASKDDEEAARHALRNAFQMGRILIHPRCKATIEHLEGAIWNKARTSYERSDRLGHADHVDALKYLWRSEIGRASCRERV